MTHCSARVTHAPFVGAALVTFALWVAAAPAGAVVVGQVDTFEDGTTMGWRHGSPSAPLPPIHVSGGGPGGSADDYLAIRTDGAEGTSGSRMLALNTAQWLGNYLAADVDSIALDARNPNAAALVLRFAFRGGGGSTFITSGVTLPAGAPWSRLTFDLAASNMDLMIGDYSACFGGVTMVRLLHNPFAPTSDTGEAVRDASGAPIAAQLHADNITAVPEPAAGAALVPIAGILTQRRRRRP